MKSLECTCLNFVVQEKTSGVYLSWVVLEILVQSYAYEDFSSTFILGSLWKPGAMHVKTWGVCLYLWWSLKARCNAYEGVGSSSIVLESTVQCIGIIQKYALGITKCSCKFPNENLRSLFILDCLWKRRNMMLDISKCLQICQ